METREQYRVCNYRDGRWYMRAWKRARATVASGGRVCMFRDSTPLDTDTFTCEMREALDRRINLRGGLNQAGRKWDSDWQRGCGQDARKINAHFGRRIALRLCNLSTAELRRRYVGRIPANYSDD